MITPFAYVLEYVPVVGMRPGFMTLQVTVDFLAISLRACSNEVITLHCDTMRINTKTKIKKDEEMLSYDTIYRGMSYQIALCDVM